MFCLWLDAMNHIKSYHTIFKKNGGVADFHLINDVPNNGHELIEYPDKWKSLIDDFLNQLI